MEYDQFQKEAINYIDQGYSVIVSAPTGAGKTVIAEYIISRCLNQNEKAIYTAPIKALSNQKFRDFQVQYKEEIGIITGDVSINSHASVLIMTTEIFRNKLLEEPDMLKEYKWIIFDEIHYLDDIERGTVWEESIIFLPPHIRILALSATIPNIDELAMWINSIHRIELKVVKENNRPVPLHFYYNHQRSITDNLENLKKNIFPPKKLYSKKTHSAFSKTHDVAYLIEYIKENNKLPCIYFSFNRRHCEEMAGMISVYNFLNKKEEEQIIQAYDSLCHKFDLVQESSSAYMYPFVRRGIAYHHAGMLPTLKEVIERLFTSGLLKVIFTTETFAMGINMPARSVIFDELCKNYGRMWRPLKTRDLYQMAGRAGRRGIDTEGFIWCRVNPKIIKWDQINRIINGQNERINSQLNTSYATLLHLYDDLGEKLYEIYSHSFHYFQSDKKDRAILIKQMKNKIGLLKLLQHIKDGILTPKGIFASQMYGYELPLAELFDRNYFEHMNEYDLSILVLSFVYEPRKNKMFKETEKMIPKHYKWIARMVIRENEKIRNMERRLNINPICKEVYFKLSPLIEAWMKGEEFEKIMKHTEEDEGEIVRYFRMTMQILKEIQSSVISPDLQTKAERAIKLINRGVIDAEKQLKTI
ncbi:DEAD/DEAH box helicase [Candidatus Desantisbacteria bacterium]|nr:DEAD/DEAH box helicase [Candidatus Desantisbacteria bacterium]